MLTRRRPRRPYRVPAAPVAAFSANAYAGSFPRSVAFADESTGGPYAHLWDFGDGETSTEQNPTHAYAGPGPYDVTLTVRGGGGSDPEAKVKVIAGGPPGSIALAGFASGGGFYQNAGKTLTAAVGGPVRAWGKAVGSDAVAPSDVTRPTRRATGLEFGGTQYLDFDNTGLLYPTAGAFTLYVVGVTPADGAIWCPMGESGGFGGIIRYSDNSIYFTSDQGSVLTSFFFGNGAQTGQPGLFRFRRTAANAVFAHTTSLVAEASVGTQAGSVGWGRIGGRSSQLTDSNGIIREVWLLASDTVATGTDTAIAAYFLAKFGLALGT